MSPERWRQIEEVFQHALDLTPSERRLYVAEKCGDDGELRAEVEKLLAQFADASSFIETPAYDNERAGVLSSLMRYDEDDDPMLGTILGSYRIEREIGRGGMGAVYEAIRADGEFRRKAAIKIVKRGMDTDFILRRFRNERQILATLEHPFITRLLDGGTTDDSRPYFVMDYIEGLPLYRYADKNRLTIDERLKLFLKICEAVEYAHQNLVIHRDLKPSNILVTPDGTPRLLDFGIAKLLDPKMASDTLQPTATAMRMMTIDYASPEQIKGEKVTFATDIYSLGVILFELLTGHRPYRFPNRTPHEVARVICDEPPMLPSSAITRSEETLPIINIDQEALTIRHLAELRRNSPENLRELMRGNLDNITLKALCKLPDERYQSVSRFREDLEKHRAGKPVSTPFYFPPEKNAAAPNQAKTKLIAVLPLKLLNFAAATTESTDENYLSLGLADAIISRLTSVRDFTVRPTSSIAGYEKSDVDPLEAGRELGVDFVLDGRIKKFAEKLRISLQMLDVRKGSIIWAGRFDEKFTDVLALEDAISEQVADALVTQVTGETRVKLGRRGTENAEAYEAYLKGRFHWNQFTSDSLPKAIEYFQKAVALDPNYALAHVGIADFYIWSGIYGLMPSLDSIAHAEKAVKKALAIDDTLGEAYTTYGLIHTNKFDWQEGERLHRRAIELAPNYSNAHEWLSSNLVGGGNFAEGIREIELAESLDPLSLRTKTLVAWTKYQAGEFADALAKADEIINFDKNFPQGHLQRGNVLIELGRSAEAVTEIEKVMKLMPASSLVKFQYCFALAADKRLEDARKVYAEMRQEAAENHVKPLFLAYAAVAVGEIDAAFRYFNQAADERDSWLNWFGVDIKLEPLRRDKRYLELLRRMKNPLVGQFEKEFSNDGERSIAVLPFQFIGEIETGEAYLSVGLADAMITRLSRLKNLTVRPTSSIVRFHQPDFSLTEAGRELGVHYILDGRLKKAGNRLRITVQLLDAAKNSTVWAETIDETLDDILQLEDSICFKVLRSLTPQLTGEELSKFEKRGTRNPKAYEAYLRGRFNWHSYTVEGIAKALVCYYEAIAEDENFALPYAGVADYYNFLSIFGVMSSEESFPAAKQAAEKAIALDENLAEAYTSLGITAYGYDWDFEKAKKLFEKSLQINPNSAETRLWYGYIFGIRGNHEKAVTEFEKAEMLNPQSPSVPVSFALTLRNARQFEKGREKLYRALELQPTNPTALQGFCWFVNPLKNYDEAETMCRKAVEVSQRQNLPLYAYGYTLAVIGKPDESRRIVEELAERSRTQYVPPIYFALIYTALGEPDAAFEWLEKCFAVRDFWIIWLPIDPRFDALKADKRFAEFCRRIKPLTKAEETIHQSQIPTKILTANELKAATPEKPKAATAAAAAATAKPNFFNRHKYKFAFAVLLAALISYWYAVGVLTVSIGNKDAANTVPAQNSSLAVLPFVNETANAENDFLTDGLSDTLINRLSNLPSIRVLSRAAAFKYKGVSITPQKAGEELNVETILSGKLTKRDGNVEIYAELIDVKKNSVIWKNQYNRPDAEIITLQNQIAEDVAKQFKGAANDPKQTTAKIYTNNTQAFEFYLKGEFERQKSTPDGIKQAIDFYRKALEIDANYALAFQGLALAYRSAPAYGTLLPPEAYPLAKESAMKALAIDPTLGTAYVPLASMKATYDWDFAGAEKDYRQAIQFAPNNAEAHYSYGNFLVSQGRSDEGLNELRIAQQFDPLSANAATNIGWALYIAGRFDEAEMQIKQVIARDPNFARAYMNLGEIYEEEGKYEQAIEMIQKSKQLSNDHLAEMALGHALAMAGRKAEATKIAQELEAKVLKKEVSPFLPAVVYAGLKENDKAFYWLERAFQERSNWLSLAKIGRRLKPLRSDPRFDDLLKRIGFN